MKQLTASRPARRVLVCYYSNWIVKYVCAYSALQRASQSLLQSVLDLGVGDCRRLVCKSLHKTHERLLASIDGFHTILEISQCRCHGRIVLSLRASRVEKLKQVLDQKLGKRLVVLVTSLPSSLDIHKGTNGGKKNQNDANNEYNKGCLTEVPLAACSTRWVSCCGNQLLSRRAANTRVVALKPGSNCQCSWGLYYPRIKGYTLGEVEL